MARSAGKRDASNVERSDYASNDDGGNDAIALDAIRSVGGDPGSDYDADAAIDPASLAGGGSANDEPIRYNKDGSVAKKRGRKPGQVSSTSSVKGAKGKKSGGKDRSASVAFISMSLYGIHSAAAKWVTELEISQDEAHTLGGAIYDVADFYEVAPSAEQAAWMKLAGALAQVYGPRIGSAYINARRPRAQKVNGQSFTFQQQTAPSFAHAN